MPQYRQEQFLTLTYMFLLCFGKSSVNQISHIRKFVHPPEYTNQDTDCQIDFGQMIAEMNT